MGKKVSNLLNHPVVQPHAAESSERDLENPLAEAKTYRNICLRL